MIEFGRDICCHLAKSETREWLVTNGIGGFASGTIPGILTRRYHGLLIAALQPPSGRMYLVSKLDETIKYAGQTFKLFANRWTGGMIEPNGFEHIERFRLEGTTPVWTYACADALLEKRIWMQRGANTTYVQYRLLRSTQPVDLSANALVNYRVFHSETHADGWEMPTEAVTNGVKVTAYEGAVPIYLLSKEATATPQHDWHRRYFLMREANRGFPPVEDHLNVAQFNVILAPGDTVTFVLSTEANPRLDGEQSYVKHRAYEDRLLARAKVPCEDGAPFQDAVRHFVLAANQFIVNQPHAGDPDGRTIMTGYHWFESTTRGTMMALPGLMLTTGHADTAGKILRKYALLVDQGMLPDRYPVGDQQRTYTALDATLWYIETVRAYHAATGNKQFIRELYPALQDIIAWLNQGTHHNIHADPEDGLLVANSADRPLTWMKAKIGDQPVTPRSGKPVEINALWYNALHTVINFANMLGESTSRYEKMLEKVEEGFGRFWNDELGYCYDVLDTADGNDARLRPNQLLAVALHYTPLSPQQQQQVVDVCAQKLLTSHGLRTLSPDDPAYISHYGGDSQQRDSAYHQGTVWLGLMGIFIKAHLRVYKNVTQAYSLLRPFTHQLADHGVGFLSEVSDGTPPFTPHGCIAHSWSVAEALHACEAITAMAIKEA